MTVEKLIEDTKDVLSRYFTAIVNGVRLTPEVYDHTEEMFLCGEEGISVWCELPKGALTFFCGDTSFIITVEDGQVYISAFFGEECIDTETAEKRSEEIWLGSWTIEDYNFSDYLLMVCDFSASLDLTEEFSRRFAEFSNERFVQNAKELLACFR